MTRMCEITEEHTEKSLRLYDRFLQKMEDALESGDWLKWGGHL